MPKIITFFIVAGLFCISLNGCASKTSKNTKQNSEIQVSPELQKAIGNIDQMDSSKISDIPINNLDVSF